MSTTKHTPPEISAGLSKQIASALDTWRDCGGPETSFWAFLPNSNLQLGPAMRELCDAHDDLLATCEFLMARCQNEGLDVLGGAYETEFQHAHQNIANAKANQEPT